MLSNQSGTILVCDTKNNTVTTRRLLNVHIYSANVYGDMLLTLSQDGVLNIWDGSYNLLKSVQSIAKFTNFITICKNGDLLMPQQQDKSTCVIHRLPIDYILKHPAKSFDFNSIPKFQDEQVNAEKMSPRL